MVPQKCRINRCGEWRKAHTEKSRDDVVGVVVNIPDNHNKCLQMQIFRMSLSFSVS